MNPNPAAASNNLHHTIAYRSEEEWFEDMLGKGPGDPDVIGYYPGQEVTHNYPQITPSSILISNELTSNGKSPF